VPPDGSAPPPNVVVAKVADFGLSRRVGPAMAGMLKTWQYLAPEVIDSRHVEFDERCDVYSFGIVAWEVYTRGYPFAEHTQYCDVNVDSQGAEHVTFRELEMKRAIICDNVRPTLPVDGSMPALLVDIVRNCWLGDYRKRPHFRDIHQHLSLMLPQRVGSHRRGHSRNISIDLRHLVGDGGSGDDVSDAQLRDSQATTSEDDESDDQVGDYASDDGADGDDDEQLEDNLLDHLHTIRVGSRVRCMLASGHHVWVGLSNGAINVYDALRILPSARAIGSGGGGAVAPLSKQLTLGQARRTSATLPTPPAKPLPARPAGAEVPQTEVAPLRVIADVLDGGRIYDMVVVGRSVWAAGDRGLVSVLSRDTFEQTSRFSAHEHFIKCLLRVDSATGAPHSVWSASPLEGAIRAWPCQLANDARVPPVPRSSIELGEGIQEMLQVGAEHVWCAAGSELFVLRWRSEELVSHWTAHDGDINCLAVANDTVVSGSSDKAIKIWRLDNFSALRTIRLHTNKVLALHVTEEHIVSAGWDCNLILHALRTHRPVQELGVHKDSIRCIMSMLVDMPDIEASVNVAKRRMVSARQRHRARRRAHSIASGGGGDEELRRRRLVWSGSFDDTIAIFRYVRAPPRPQPTKYLPGIVSAAMRSATSPSSSAAPAASSAALPLAATRRRPSRPPPNRPLPRIRSQSAAPTLEQKRTSN
jgi:Protein tyrosine and serine/threonine kinase/WD domain, G-beta repeat